MRLDKFLTECGLGSRREVKKIIDEKLIKVEGIEKISSNTNLDLEKNIVLFQGKKLEYKEFRYYVLNKKAGYITATEDKREKTVMELLPDWVIKKNLAPVGRLDKDTEGVLLLTNDGKLAHKLLSPKNHVEKTYYVETRDVIGQNDIKKLEEGVDIGGYITLPSKIKMVDSKKIFLTIQEGKFHQVKKMLKSIENEVLYLKRISFGKIKLENLNLGEVIEIEKENIC